MSMYNRFAISMTTSLKGDVIGSAWLGATAFDWPRQLHENVDFCRWRKHSQFHQYE